MVQSGGWEDGTPAWLAAARIFLLGSIAFGYLFSATLFLISARLMHHDKLKLETVCQSGSLDAVSTLWGPPPPELVWNSGVHSTHAGMVGLLIPVKEGFVVLLDGIKVE